MLPDGFFDPSHCMLSVTGQENKDRCRAERRLWRRLTIGRIELSLTDLASSVAELRQKTGSYYFDEIY